MRSHRGLILLPGVVCTLLAGGAVFAQQGGPAVPPVRERPAADPGVEAMRREVEAKAREREQMFARIRALGQPAVPDAPDPVLRIVDVRRAAGVALPRTVVRDRFNAMMFGTLGPDDMRIVLDDLLDKKVRDAGAVWGLSQGQETRLRLAGKGDIKRLFDELEDRRAEFNEVSMDRDRLPDLLSKLGPLRVRLQSPWSDEASLFSKTLRRIRYERRAERRDALR